MDYMKKIKTLSDLTRIQYEVTQKNATEKPYENEFWMHREKGIYVDIVSKEPLFSSLDKFESSCGWPSFSKPVSDVNTLLDTTHGMRRIEVRSKEADSHLGHLFDDGPSELGGLRYCINSASLEFITYHQLEERGYKEYMKLFEGVKNV